MPIAPSSIHRPADPASFHLLFLSDGFLDVDENEFLTHCRAITAELLEIDPFKLAASQLSVSAVFTASQQRGVGAAAGNTAFRFFVTPAGELRTRRPGTIVAQVADVTPVPLGGAIAPPLPVTGRDVWMNENTRGSRAVCVVVRHAAKVATLTKAYAAGDLDVAADATEDLAALVPIVAMSMWPVLPGAPQDYTNAATAAAAVLARELGVVCGLAYESELTDAAHETYDPAAPEPVGPNLVTDRALRVGTAVDVERIPWRGLIRDTRRQQAVLERDHPALAVAGETSLDEIARYAPIGNLMRTNVVLLRHSRNPANPNDTSALTATRYYTPGRLRLVEREPQLIEGGGGFRRGVYRPSVECLMRFEGTDVAQPGGGVARQVVPFCAVCEKHLHTWIQDGAGSFRFDSVRMLRGPVVCVGRNPSRVAERLTEWVAGADANYLQALQRMACVEATVNRYETFFREQLGWRDTERIRLQNQGWYANEIQFPISAGRGLNMWRIWMTHVVNEDGTPGPLRTIAGLRTYAGLGAPGAIWYGGLGCLANRRRRQPVENDVDGNPVEFYLVDSLTANQLGDLAPGSLLQIWRDRQTYVEIVRYAHRLTDAVPRTGGHSLFYMGVDEAGEHVVADQIGFAEPLTSGWRSDYTFWIAAQWRDAVNVVVPAAP